MKDFRRMFGNCRTFWSEMDSDGVELFMGHADRMEAHFDRHLKVNPILITSFAHLTMILINLYE